MWFYLNICVVLLLSVDWCVRCVAFVLLFGVFRLLCLVCCVLIAGLLCCFSVLVYVLAGFNVLCVAFCLSFDVCCLLVGCRWLLSAGC